jgi:hypothetical protein
VGREHAGRSFQVETQENGDILLKAVAVIPESDVWLFRNPTAMRMVKEGLTDIAEGKLVDRRSYASHTDNVDD